MPKIRRRLDLTTYLISAEITRMPGARMRFAVRFLRALVEQRRIWFTDISPIRAAWLIGAGGIVRWWNSCEEAT